MQPSTFADILQTEVAILQAQFPELAAGLTKAHAILSSGGVFPDESGREALVRSQSDPQLWHPVNGTCDCTATYYHSGICAHRLAWRLYQRVSDRLLAAEERYTISGAVDAADRDIAPPLIPAQYLTTIQGQPFIRFQGLLELAHARGLVELSTTVVSVSEALAVCQAVARFSDGRVFTDIGDASPDNVAKHLKPHFVRMAATRAAARALRRALNISACAVEELGDEAGT